jgi:hypothetical protein
MARSGIEWKHKTKESDRRKPDRDARPSYGAGHLGLFSADDPRSAKAEMQGIRRRRRAS